MRSYLTCLLFFGLALFPRSGWGQTAAAQACSTGAPTWSVNPAAFESTMSVTGAFLVAGTRTSDPADRVAAFVDGVLRGVATPQDVNGAPVFFLTVYGSTAGEEVTFQAYDAAGDQVWTVEETLAFEANAIHGLPSQPMTWTATCGDPVDVETAGADLPATAILEPAYPNPFHPQTTIRYRTKAAQPVHLAVYDLLGREVAVLVDGVQPPGTYEVVFNAGTLPSGMYVYRLTTAATVRTRSVTLLR